MARLGEFLGKQSRILLENDNQALMYIAVLTVIPFAGWLSAAVVALITLRKGWSDGFKGALVGFVALLALSSITMDISAALITAAMAFVPCYLAAGVLYSTASWKIASGFVVLLALLVIASIHWFAPEFISDQLQYIQAAIKAFEQDSSDGFAAKLLINQSKENKVIFANYLVGIQALSLVVSALTSLLVARSMQSRLFYPGGFRQEMLAFRISSFWVFVLILAVFGTYQHSPLAISCLPLLITYYVFAGLSLSFSVLAKDKGLGTLVLLIVPLMLIPFVMLPIYVVVGALDSLFNLRSYLSAKGR